jgi:uncharacterized protein with NRDE domain
MCLAALAHDPHARFPFVLAANRDEFFERPTAPLDWWVSPTSGGSRILGGRDLRAGGTWLGLTGEGRLAFVTNVREIAPIEPGAPSRGAIVPAWLGGAPTEGELALAVTGAGYPGVNVIAVDWPGGACFYASNRAPSQRIETGVHAVSNAALDTPWPKVVALKERMAAAWRDGRSAEELAATLFAALADDRIAPDPLLPRTGVPLSLERQLSAAFIRTPEHAYGTRCSTVIIVDDEAVRVHERTYAPDGSAPTGREVTLPLAVFPAWGRPG